MVDSQLRILASLVVVLGALTWRASALDARAAPLPSPFSVPPTQFWRGDDGNWSTFSFQAGTPFQNVELLPYTSADTFMPVLPEGCISSDPSNCPLTRGGTFNPNGSSTWSEIGIYTLVIPEENVLGLSGNAEVGQDTVELAWPGSPAPTITSQIIAGFATKDFYTGGFGLEPRKVNISSLTNSYLSPVENLRKNNDIPSTTWSYTAGYYYSQPPTFGSLVLGGYDTTRFSPNSVTFPFGNDISRDLLVGIQGISSDAFNSTLLPNPVFSFLDSSVAHIWLPVEACQAFETAFNLTWNSTSNLYPLNVSQHQALLSLNPTIDFTLGPALAGGESVDISLPYQAFDTYGQSPFTDVPGPYFPIRRAQNQSQYTLGRVFFQHAYLTADFDRGNFSVSRALFPSEDTAPQLHPILPPSETESTANNSTTTAPPTTLKKLSGGAIAGIAIGAAVGLVAIGAAILLLLRRRHQRASKKANGGVSPTDSHNVYLKAELPDIERMRFEAGGNEKLPELIGAIHQARTELDVPPSKQSPAQELDGSSRVVELDNTRVRREGRYSRAKAKNKRLPATPMQADPIYELQ